MAAAGATMSQTSSDGRRNAWEFPVVETRNLPVVAWGTALHNEKRRVRSRRRYIGAAILGTTLCLSAMRLPTSPLLLWNASASAPIGLYAIRPASRIARGDLLVMRLPKAIARFAAARGYLPEHVPLLKPSGAGTGDQICGISRQIWINGRRAAVRRVADGIGRPLPLWQSCVRLGTHQIFPLNPTRADSFDGRYFGPISDDAVIGHAVPLWIWSAKTASR